MSSQSNPDRDELYVGYLTGTPPGIRRFLRRLVPLLALPAVALAVTLPALHRPFEPGRFEFGQPRDLSGWIEEHPYPSLLIAGDGDELPARLLLVGAGKHGARREVAGLEDRKASINGTLIERPPHRMIELAATPDAEETRASSTGTPSSGTYSTRPPPPAVAALRTTAELGEITIRGEIVDSKCFLGVMKPGRGKPHRSCAARCISGGIPPAVFVSDRAGNERLLLLVDADGDPLSEKVLPYVGEPIEISGQLQRRGETLYLLAAPDSYRRMRGR